MTDGRRGIQVKCGWLWVLRDCSLADAVQREPRYLSCVEIDRRINGLRVRRAPLAFLRLSLTARQPRGKRVQRCSRHLEGIDAINTLTRAVPGLLRALKARNTRRCCPLHTRNRSFLFLFSLPVKLVFVLIVKFR